MPICGWWWLYSRVGGGGKCSGGHHSGGYDSGCDGCDGRGGSHHSGGYDSGCDGCDGRGGGHNSGGYDSGCGGWDGRRGGRFAGGLGGRCAYRSGDVGCCMVVGVVVLVDGCLVGDDDVVSLKNSISLLNKYISLNISSWWSIGELASVTVYRRGGII